jgi:uncharacterized protein (TIGR03437 family)
MYSLAREVRSFVVVFLLGIALPSAQVITTVAGSTWYFRGADGPAVQAQLGLLAGLTADGAGNIYIADARNHLVLRVTPSGTILVVAGNGLAGFSGDGGPATSASLDNPFDVVIDRVGNLYIADALNRRVRKVDVNGVISTFAGNGTDGIAGDLGPAVAAGMRTPVGLAVDPNGSIFIADALAHRVRRVTPNGIITTIAGNGQQGYSGDGGPATLASLSRPFGLTTDTNGNLYICDEGNSRIRRVSTAGVITTFAGGGTNVNPFGIPATTAALKSPVGIASDSAGSVYIADEDYGQVFRVEQSGIITRVVGTALRGSSGDGGPALLASLNTPTEVTVDREGNLYIGDTGNHRLRRVAGNQVITTYAGNGGFKFAGDGGPATSAALNVPVAVTLDYLGNLYIPDCGSHVVRRVTRDGTISTFAGNGTEGISGDGGPATSARLSCPADVAVDNSGNVYIAEYGSDRIRRVNPLGIISRFAGDGRRGFGGDGGPATTASLDGPAALAVDASGNIYVADVFNGRVRKVTTAGTINTVAGSGGEGFSGDGGPATQATLFLPGGVAVDAAGNVYIADSSNHRIRRVDANGIINTVAGDGRGRFNGDTGVALSTSLNDPRGVTVDLSGNVYVADYGNHRIRRFVVGGNMTTVAGLGLAAGFYGDGGLALDAPLNEPQKAVSDQNGNLLIADTGNERIRKVLSVPPNFVASPVNIRLAAPGGSFVTQQVLLTGPIPSVAWTAGIATEGRGWLSVSATAGTLPATIVIGADTTVLNQGTYRGAVTVQVPLASPSTQTITVELSVTSALSPQLVVQPKTMTFDAGGQRAVLTESLQVINQGGGTLNWTAQAQTADGASWLSISPSSGTASARTPMVIRVAANPSSLAAGAYSGSIRITRAGTNEVRLIGVTLLVVQGTRTILLSRSGLSFTGVEGSPAALTDSIGIINNGQGVMNWALETETLTGGPWLSTTVTSGRSDASSLEVPMVEVKANIAGLRAGQYTGSVKVNAPDAGNNPQIVTVNLTVLPPGTNPGPEVKPTGLIYAARAGTSSPSSQTVRVFVSGPSSVELVAGLLTLSGGEWLEALPRNAVVTATQPGSVTVQPKIGELGPGVYRGTMTLAFREGSPSQPVDILLLVVPQATSVADNENLSGFGCTGTRLLAVQRTLPNNFSAETGRPTQLEVQLLDDCGNAVPNATVVASFSNGDSPLSLASLRNGMYSATWRPLNPGQTITTLQASLAGLAPVELTVRGQVSSNTTTSAVFPRGVVNAASFAPEEVLAPGSIVSVFGQRLASATAQASSVPLPKTLADATLLVGGIQAPLFYASDRQINAQLPFELPLASRPQVVARGRQTLSVPETITIAAARPGIFTVGQDGKGQGAILNSQGVVVNQTAPATVGDVVTVYATGLGLTDPAVQSGQPATANPLSQVKTTVTATIGGLPAPVQFAGLAPGYVGLYQCNVQIPSGIPLGPAVPLVLTQNGVSSNTVTLAVR